MNLPGTLRIFCVPAWSRLIGECHLEVIPVLIEEIAGRPGTRTAVAVMEAFSARVLDTRIRVSIASRLWSTRERGCLQYPRCLR